MYIVRERMTVSAAQKLADSCSMTTGRIYTVHADAVLYAQGKRYVYAVIEGADSNEYERLDNVKT